MNRSLASHRPQEGLAMIMVSETALAACPDTHVALDVVEQLMY